MLGTASREAVKTFLEKVLANPDNQPRASFAWTAAAATRRLLGTCRRRADFISIANSAEGRMRMTELSRITDT